MKKLISYILLSCVVLICSCSKTKDGKENETARIEETKKENLNSAGVKEEDHEFTVQYLKPRNIYKIEKEDLNKDDSKEIIVLSVSKDPSERYNDYYNFDLL